jgi:hypothetical protein
MPPASYHTADLNSASFFVNFGLPFFNRNQGEMRVPVTRSRKPRDAGIGERHRVV